MSVRESEIARDVSATSLYWQDHRTFEPGNSVRQRLIRRYRKFNLRKGCGQIHLVLKGDYSRSTQEKF
jgi:hypothetical protein